ELHARDQRQLSLVRRQRRQLTPRHRVPPDTRGRRNEVAQPNAVAPIEDAEPLGQRSALGERCSRAVEHHFEQRQSDANARPSDDASQHRAARKISAHGVTYLGSVAYRKPTLATISGMTSTKLYESAART